MNKVGVFFFILILMVSSVTQAESVLDHRSWQFHAFNWEHLRQAIPKARQAGMNRIQLSHKIIHNSEEVWMGDRHQERLELVNKCIDLAHQQDLKVDIWVHEFSAVPEEYVKDKRIQITPELWKWLDAKYEKFFSLVPGADGLVMTFSETDYEVYKGDKIEQQAQAIENIVNLAEAMFDICEKHDKKIILRTFVHYPDELQWIGQAFDQICEKHRGDDRLVIMTKITPHDWHPYYPYNPMLGRFEGVNQIVEFDLGHEYTGKSYLFYPMVDYLHRSMQYSRQQGVMGAVGRVDRLRHLAMGTPNELNIHSFSRLTQDDQVKPETLWNEWVSQYYGLQNGEKLIIALRRLFDVTNITFFPLTQWIFDHSRICTWNYAKRHIDMFDRYSVRRWIPSPYYGRLDEWKAEPAPELFWMIENEKDLARRFLNQTRTDVGRLKDRLPEEKYQRLIQYLDLAALSLDTYGQHSLAFFKSLRYLQLDENDLERIVLQRELEDHKANLLMLADETERQFGKDVLDGNPMRIRYFVKKVEENVPPVK